MDRLEPVAAGVAVDRRAPRQELALHRGHDGRPRGRTSPRCSRARRSRSVRSTVEWPCAATRAAAARRWSATHAGAAAVLTYPVRVRRHRDVPRACATRLLREGLSPAAGSPGEVGRPRRGAAGAGDGRRGPASTWWWTGSRSRRHAERGSLPSLEQAWGEATRRGASAGSRGPAPRWCGRAWCARVCARGFEPARPGLFSLPVARRRVSRLPRLRSHARHRLGQGHARRRAEPRRGRASAPGTGGRATGSAASWSALRQAPHPARRALARAHGRSSASGCSRARATTGADATPGVRGWFRWLESRTYKMHVRVLLARYRAYDALPRLRRCAAQPRRARLPGRGARPRRLAPAGDARGAPAARRRSPPAPDRASSPGASWSAASASWSGSASATSGSTGRAAPSPAARRSACRSPQRWAPRSPGRSSSSTSRTVGLHPSDLPPLTTALRRARPPRQRGAGASSTTRLSSARRPRARARARRGPEGGRLVLRRHPGRARGPSGPRLPRGCSAARARTPGRGARRGGWIRGAGRDAQQPRGHRRATAARRARARSRSERLGQEHTGRGRGVSAAWRGRSGHADVEAPGAPFRRPEPCRSSGWCWSIRLLSGRTSRGNAATYTKAWDVLRKRFAAEPDAVLRGFSPAHFSFNVDGGPLRRLLRRGLRDGGDAVPGGRRAHLSGLPRPALQARGARGSPRRHSVSPRCSQMTVDEVLEAFGGDRAHRRGAPAAAARSASATSRSGSRSPRCPAARRSGSSSRGRSASAQRGHALRPRRAERGAPRRGRGPGARGVARAASTAGPACWWSITTSTSCGPRTGWSSSVRAVGAMAAASWPRARPRRSPAGRPAPGEALRAARDRASPGPRAPPVSANGARWLEVEHAREHNLRRRQLRHPARQADRGHRPQRLREEHPRPSTSSSPRRSVGSSRRSRPTLGSSCPPCRGRMWSGSAGVPPSVALEQRTARAGATSTVATVTEVAHYLRLLFAKLGTPHCPKDDTAIAPRSAEQLLAEVGAMRRSGRAARAGRPGAQGHLPRRLHRRRPRRGRPRPSATGRACRPTRRPSWPRTREHTIDLVVWSGPAADMPAQAFRAGAALGSGRGEGARAGRREAPLVDAQLPARCGTGGPGARPALVLLQHRAGPLRGL